MKNSILSLLFLAFFAYGSAQGPCNYGISLDLTQDSCCFEVYILYSGPGCDFFPYDKVVLEPDPIQPIYFESIAAASLNIDARLENNTAVFQDLANPPYFFQGSDSIAQFIGEVCVSNPQDLNQASLTANFADEASMTTPPFTTPPVTIGIPDCVSPFPMPGGPVEIAKVCGDSTDNVPTKIKAFGNGIYLAGTRVQQGQDYATFSKFDLFSGALLWEREFDFPSRIFDFEHVPNGPGSGDDEFLLVGRTEPFQIPGVGPQDNRSLLAKVDNWGNVVFVKRYQQSGRESFNRIIRHTLNGNPGFPYYVLGSKNPDSPPGTSGATGEDVTVLYNLNNSGDINWAFEYTDFAGVELETHRGLFQVKGNLCLTGNDVPFNNGMVFQVFAGGGSWSPGSSIRFEDQWDIYGGVQLGNRIVYHGTDFGTGEAILIVEFDAFSYYGLRFPGIREFRDIGLDGQGRIYVTAQADAPAPNNYWVVCRVLDDGMQLSLDYAKYILDIGQDFSEAQIYVSPEYDRIFYADGRLAPSSNYDILWGAFDLDLNTSCAVPFSLSPTPLTINASGFEVKVDSLFDPPFLDGNFLDIDYGCVFTCGYSPCPVDVTPPLILCPPDITVSAGDEDDLTVTGIAQAFDDCSINLIPDASDVIAGQSPCPSTITRTWSVTDNAGLTSQCTQTITVDCSRNCGEAVVTCFPGFVDDNCRDSISPDLPVLGIVDVRDRTGAPLGSSGHWSDASSNIYHPAGAWTHSTMGLVFGLAIDGADNIYATTTTVYGCEDGIFQPFGPAGPGGIYRIDPTDAVSQFITTGPFVPGGNQLPNTGSGLGNICYDPDHDQLFVTNFHDGMIYRIALPAGTIVDRFDPFTTGNGPSTDNPNFVELDERTWGIAYNKVDGRLYFSRWRENRNRAFTDRANEIWSVGIDPGTGAFDALACSGGTCEGGEELELEMPYHIYRQNNPPAADTSTSNPVSDISFSEKGFMLLAERTMIRDCGNAQWQCQGFRASDFAHGARVLEYYQTEAGTWKLTPGHASGVPPFSVQNSSPFHDYANELKFLIGESSTPTNASGGIDYGYESFLEGDTPMICDNMVWASLDGYRLGNININVYGMMGVDAIMGGNSNNSYLIDYDNMTTNTSKSMQGDVEIFRCIACPPSPPPCDSLMVMVSDSVVVDSSCCYTVDIKNQTNGTITKLCMELETPDWILNTGQLGSGFTWDVVSSTTLCIENPDGIPVGDLQNVLQFCLTEGDAQAVSPQRVVFSWYEEECPLSCQDTLLTVCNPPLAQDTCVVIEDLSANCIPDSAYAHCVNFTVTNTSSFAAYGLVLEDLPSGFSFGDCGCGGSSYGINGKEWAFDWFADPLDVGESRTICVSVISALPILNPVDVCFNAALEGLTSCCSSPLDYCVTLEPCCDPCSEMTVSAEIRTGPGENCCYALDFQYDCDYAIFNKIEFDILTDGVSFGSYSLGDDGNWQVCGMPALDNVCIEPLLPGIGKGTYDDLFRFCLTDIDNSSEIPQELQVTFWATGSDGQDSIACDTILFFDCQPPVEQLCAFITDEVIECVPDSMKYRITVNVENVSVPSFDAYFLGVLPFGEFDPNPIPLVPPLPSNGTTRTVSFCYEPAVFPDPDGELVLVYQLKDVLGDSCCNGNQVLFDTLALPFCDTCAFDMVPPSITCPPDVQLSNIDPCEEFVILDLEAPVAFDNCSDSLIVVCDAMTGDTVFCSGDGTPIIQTVTCTATDQAGNSSSCSYALTIICNTDTIPPVLTCPPDTQVVNIDQCIGGAFVDLVLPDAVDNCTDSLEVECDLQPGEFIPCGSNGAPFVRTVTCMATDEAGNTGTCSYDILVQCNCVNITGSSIACTPDGNGFEYDFVVNAENLTGGDCEGSVTVTSLTSSAMVIPGYSVVWNGTNVEVQGQLSATIPIPLTIDLQLGFSCTCADSSIVNCENVVTLTTPCCQTIGLEDQVFCSEEPVVNIPILGCEPDLVDQIFWYIAPGSCPASFGEPFQVTDADDCLDLVFPVSIFGPGPYCIKAEVIQNSAGGPCSVLSTNEASVFICTPRSCSVSPASQEFCYQGAPVLPDELVLSVSNADSICTFSIQWQELQNGGWVDVPGETGRRFQPPPIDFDGAPEDCFSDHSYRARITDVCGERYCTATIRLYNDDAPNGTLELDPPEFTPLCPGQDATLRYNPECAGDPSQWAWYARTASTGYAQIPGSGNRNPLFNTNKLFETTWFKIEKTNGVCPVDEVEFQLDVKEPLVIDYFEASYSPQCTPIGVEMEVGFSPCCACNYTVEWYKDGAFLNATSHASTPAVFSHQPADFEGNYYAIVKDECCPNQTAKSQVISLLEPWEPLVSLPCYFKSGESAELEGLLANLPVGTSCTYEWFGPGGSLISTDPIISVNQGGEYTFKVSCNDGCTKEKTVTLIECDLECEVVVSNTIITVGKFAVRIFPNPTNSILTLQSGNIPSTDLEVRVFNLQGKVLKNRKWPKGHTEIQLDVTSFASGVYVIDVVDKDGNAYRELFLKS